MNEGDTILLALGLAFVGFAILAILTLVSARFRPAAEERRELKRAADRLAQMVAREEAVQRRNRGANASAAVEAERRRQQELARFDDGT